VFASLAEEEEYLIKMLRLVVACLLAVSVNCQLNWDENLYTILTVNGIREDLDVGSVIGTLQAHVTGETRRPTFSTTSTVFSVDPDTGVVILKTPLSYRNSPTFTVAFFASVTNLPEISVSVVVNVRPVNHYPVFDAPSYSVSVREDSRVSSTVYSAIFVTDVDTGNNGTITVSCLRNTTDTEQACQTFSVSTQPETAVQSRVVVILVKALDYTARSDYTLLIQAADGGVPSLITTTTLLVSVDNAGDNRPVFLDTPIIISVKEKAPSSTDDLPSIQARPGSASNATSLSIKITNDPRNYFSLGPVTKSASGVYSAKIRTNGNIDRSQLPGLSSQYYFTVTAVELFNNVETQVSSETTVTVQILDVNDNRPTFQNRTYAANVSEGMTYGATVPALTILVTDLDVGPNSQFTLQVVAEPPLSRDAFGIVPSSGTGTVAASLIVNRPEQIIYDQRRQHTLTVTATENNTTERYAGSATVTLIVQNPNNQPTPFVQQLYNVFVIDNRNIGDNIAAVSVADTSAQIVYAISAGNEAMLFKLNNVSGLLSIAKPLNASTYPSVTLTVSATNSFGLVSNARVIITVRSASSQGPKFQNEPYNTTVDENGVTMIPSILVYASPLQQDRVVRYRIVGGNQDNLFSLNKSDTNPLGSLLVMNRGVDYNDTPNRQGYFVLIIEAADNINQPLVTNTTVIVNIRDTNNHEPEFNGSATYYATITEITPRGSPLNITVNATDLDAGENSRLKYIINFGSRDNFVIDYYTGAMKVAPNADLSIEKYGNQYNITVIAVDNGSPPQTGTAMVYINVLPSVYRPPVFTQSPAVYEFTILDTSPIGYRVGTVQAVAPDAQAKFVYLVDPDSIMAFDKFGKPVTTTSGTYNYKTLLSTGNTNGVVTVAQPLNYSYVATIKFLVQANVTNPDQPIPLSNASVTVNIVPPIPEGSSESLSFYKPVSSLTTKQVNLTLFETQSPGTMVTQFGAVYVRNTPVIVTNYRIGTNNDPNNLLSLDQTTGILRVNKNISYDALPTSKTLIYEVVAYAPTPSTLSATVTASVLIKSLDDNKPTFTSNMYNFSVYENVSLNFLVGKVHAELKGASQGAIQYRLSGSPMDFSINADTGDITVLNALDAERQSLYVLTVTTVDKSGLGLLQNANAQVLIYVLDVNDNPPQFFYEPYDAQVLDSTPTNQTLIQVRAIDPDISQTNIRYTIVGGNDKGYFVIDPTTGEIRPSKNMSGAAQSTPYILNISATDSGLPPLTSYTNVNILIRNLSQDGGPPGFYSPDDGEVFKVYEGRLNETVTQVRAYSNRRQFPNITYGLYDLPQNMEANKRFILNDTTGMLTTNGALNLTEQKSYSLVIQALDNGVPSLISRRSITVQVYSDKPPTFTACSGNFSDLMVTAHTPELQPTGNTVTTVKACSNEKEPKIYYYITAGNESYLNSSVNSPPFGINKDTGRIYTTSVLKWLDSPIITINVTASNDSFGPASALKTPGATITVKVYVDGLDNDGPHFDPNPDKPSFCRGIGLKVTQGILDITGYNVQVKQFYAGDCDSPENRGHTFSLSVLQFFPPDNPTTATPVPDAFIIDADSGWVYTHKNSYREFTDGTFTMKVIATDKKGRTAASELRVYIIRESQRLRYVFGDPPKKVNSSIDPFVGTINGALNQRNGSDRLMVPDILRLHVNKNAELEFDKSDLCFHVIEKERVLSITEVQTLYRNTPLNNTYSTYGVILGEKVTPEPCNVKVTTRWWSGYWFLWWLLIALALFIFVIALILILCVCIYWPISRRNYFKSRPYVVLDDPPMAPASDFEWQQTIHRVD